MDLYLPKGEELVPRVKMHTDQEGRSDPYSANVASEGPHCSVTF